MKVKITPVLSGSHALMRHFFQGAGGPIPAGVPGFGVVEAANPHDIPGCSVRQRQRPAPSMQLNDTPH
jgi:hypothetical protein